MDVRLMLYSSRGGSKIVNTLFNQDETINTRQNSLEGGPSKGQEYRINYKQPFSNGQNRRGGRGGGEGFQIG